MISQIIGIVAFIVAVISVQMKEKSKLLFFQTIENSLKIIAYLFVGGMSGAYSEMVGLIRKLWFLKNSKEHKTNALYSLIIFCFLAVVVAIVFWEGPISLLPMFAVILGTIGLWQENIFVLRYISLVASILYGIYAVLITAYTNAFSEVFIIISIIISLIRFKYPNKFKLKFIKH